MAFTCDRCDKEITENSVIVKFETQTGLSFRDELHLCKDCYSGLVDWVKNQEPTKLGPVERVARREDSK